jgi:DNA-binding response OmpR family regulator
LAVNVLAQVEPRPAVVVFTGVLEPRLAEDLFTRGVDDVVFKPIEFRVLAAKVRAILDRRRTNAAGARGNPCQPQCAADSDSLDEGIELPRAVTMDDLLSRLQQLAPILPITPAAIEVFNLTRAGSVEQLFAIRR